MNNLIAISGKMGAGKDLLCDILQYINWKKYIISTELVEEHQVKRFSQGMELAMMPESLLFHNKKFADILKDTVCLWIGCTREQLEDREFKEKPLGSEWISWGFYANGKKWSTVLKSDEFGWDEEIKYQAARQKRINKSTHKELQQWKIFHAKPEILTPRTLLQKIGTDCGRNIIHPNIWVNSLMGQYTPESKWIISDCRFPNEADAVREKGGVNIRIERPDLIIPQDGAMMHPSETSLDDYEHFDKVFINDGSIQDLVNKVEEWIN